MNSFSTLVTVHDGKLKLLSKAEFDHGLAQFMDGQELVLSIEEAEDKHTRAQEKFFHGPILKAFMERCGYRKEEAKAVLCLRIIPREVRLLDGTIVIVPGSTSALGKRGYTELIDESMQIAAEMDIYIEDGDEWRAKHRLAVA